MIRIGLVPYAPGPTQVQTLKPQMFLDPGLFATFDVGGGGNDSCGGSGGSGSGGG